MKINKFEDLEIWQLGVKISKEVYKITSKEYFAKDYYLKDQLKRSAESISANIAEGFEKNNNNEFVKYLRIAKGSAGESRSHLHIALEVKHINRNEYDCLNDLLLKTASKIGRLILYLEERKKKKQQSTRNS